MSLEIFNNPKPPYKTKIIITDTVIQYYIYEKSIIRNSSDRLSYEKSLDGLKRVSSLQRAKQNLFLTIASNVTKYSKFITLTTATTTLDRDVFLNMFNQFRKNFQRIFGYPLKYIGVLERQKLRGIKENNEGSWHIHLVVFNSQKLHYEKLKLAWFSYGSIDIKLLRHYTHIPVYLMKYLTKEHVEFHKKTILKSHDLKKPTIIYDYNEIVPNDKDLYRDEYYMPDDTKVLFYEKKINRSPSYKATELEEIPFN